MKKLLTSAAFALAALTGPALADYPTGPVQFIVPWPPGDFEDILTRMIAADMAEATGQPASVVNRPGGGDGPFPGALEVLNAPNDGSVIGSFVIGVPIVGPQIDIGIEEDSFVPVGIFLTYPFVLAASGDAPYSNMAELADYAKENDVVLGHFGAGLTPTAVSMAAAAKMGFEFADDSAFDLLDCNTLSSGDADVINTTLALIEPCLDDINVLGNIGAQPIAKLDGVETIAAQSGVNDVELWNGLFVTKGTPQEVIDTIAAVAAETMASDEAQQLMAETGAAVYWQGQAEAEARIEADRAKSAEINEILGR
ncbi:tripartite tricarboxylate transporter substrate binding protein [Tateyamaria omphalii]|uniref:tripartite tricarboxylate transporter substrate-binding protein n=1 Tax=Tateyamaria omphalii TaxID=299262 RepID=UPI001C9A133F|nr:tripartite tricarboxylate transporter substrate-binding protein [Tateyamaria omphalii]MBY5935291.1 tripartite tricarboxylate transporter substrate binding protein [Tateyamaria omphalii]